MKSRPVLLSVAVLFAIALPAAAVSPAGLIAHWPLDGNGADASGNGNVLSLVNVAAGPDRLGTPGAAIELDASTSGLSLPDGAAADLTSQFTWAGWVRFDRIGTANDNFVAKSCCGTNATTMFYADTYSWDGARPHYNHMRFFVAAGSGNYGFEQAGPVLQNHVWYHVALVYDGPAATMKVYVNGILMDAVSNTGAGGIYDVPTVLNDSAAPLTMGRSPLPGPTGTMQGALDDVWWFSRPLTSQEIAELAGVPDCQALQTQVAALESQLQAVTNGTAGLEAILRSTFNDPQFTIPGATTVDRYESLVSALLSLNKGQLLAIYRNLGGN